MGVDIHIRAEVRKNGKWELVEEPVFKSNWDGRLTVKPFDGRDYKLFSVLANVRNSNKGEVGHIVPISQPKGWPEDASEGFKQIWFYSDDDDDDCLFAKSYLTLKEILDYDWNRTCCETGIVSRTQYKNSLMNGEYPSWWCKDIGGKHSVIVSEEDMKKIIEENIDSKNLEFYCKCTLPRRTYAQMCEFFYEETIPVLKSLIPEGGTAEDVRIIFGFDC